MPLSLNIQLSANPDDGTTTGAKLANRKIDGIERQHFADHTEAWVVGKDQGAVGVGIGAPLLNRGERQMSVTGRAA